MDWIKALVDWLRSIAASAAGAYLSWLHNEKKVAQNAAKQIKQAALDKMRYDGLSDADRKRVQDNMEQRRKKR